MSKYIRDTALGDCVRMLSTTKFLKFPEHTEHSLRNRDASNALDGSQKDIIVGWSDSDDIEVPFPLSSQETLLTDRYRTLRIGQRVTSCL